MASEHLAKAKDILFEHGWCKGRLEDGSGQHCLNGALAEAHGLHGSDAIRATWVPDDYPGFCEDQGRLAAAVRGLGASRLQTNFYAVTEFNDDPETTFEDALRALDIAMKEA